MATTNISDAIYRRQGLQSYDDFCSLCANDNGLFSNFKTNPKYVGILEHVTSEHGEHYLNVIRKHKKIYSQIDLFKKNDLIGGPQTHDYSNWAGSSAGTFSPTTLRYIKVCCDLDKFAGDLTGLKICEIGGGYGGQFLTLDLLYGKLDYSIVDLEGPLLLTEKYLNHHTLTSNIKYIKPEDVKLECYDLVISNYAFSELLLDVQDFYTRNILLSSARGYITYNQYPDNFSLEDYKSKFKAAVIDDFPAADGTNKIIFWGEQTNNTWYRFSERTTLRNCMWAGPNRWVGEASSN